MCGYRLVTLVSQLLYIYILQVTWAYSERDVILYALGAGCSTTQDDHLRFLFELSEDFCVLPTFSVLVAFTGCDLNLSKETTGIDIDPTKV